MTEIDGDTFYASLCYSMRTVRSIMDLPINLDVDYAKRHKGQLAYFFDAFDPLEGVRLPRSLLAHVIRNDQFDEVGTLWVDEMSLDAKSIRLLQEIEDSYQTTSFFPKAKKAIGSRGYVYYSSALRDSDNMRGVLRQLYHIDTSAKLLLRLYPKYGGRWEFGIYALLDCLRYKMLVLQECETPKSDDFMVALQAVITTFYDYLQGNMPSVAAIEELAAYVCQAVTRAIEVAQPADLRSYKEADHPLQNLIFREALLQRLAGYEIDLLLGIRFGGSELPWLLKKYFPRSRVELIKASNYSAADNSYGLRTFIECAGASVLVLDDNILTGRTLAQVVDRLGVEGARNVYFGCVTYSGMGRYAQMIMDDHGVVNPDVLRWSCVVGESPFSKITSSKSYTNRYGVFDKVKAKLQRRFADKNMGYKL